jgi:hypothetical protein
VSRFYLDLEFIERGHKHPIDLISIGMVSEDDREYYALNYDCDHEVASDWVKKNVLNCLPPKPLPCLYSTAKQYQGSEVGKQGWRNLGAIAEEIIEFCNVDRYGKPEFWGEWSSYDHVVFCQIFGTMMDLPEGFPMLTFDVVQWAYHLGISSNELPPSLETDGNHNALLGAKTVKARYDWLAAKQKELTGG